MKPALLSFVITLLLGLFAWGFNVRYPDIAPVWGQLAMLLSLVGLVITALIVRRDWRNFLPGTQHGFPDWIIRDLFFHIDSDVCYDDDPNNREPWIKVGRDILNRLSTGQLVAWGERDGSGGRLTPIKQDYWGGADLTYMFFGEGERYQELVHAINKEYEGGTSYRNVQFNKSQALKIWPLRNDWDAPLILSFLVPIAVLGALAITMAYPYWKRVVFPPIDRSLGIGQTLIRPYPKDDRFLQVEIEIQNISNRIIQYDTKMFFVEVGGDVRQQAKARRPQTIIRGQSQTIYSGAFDAGENKSNKTFAGVNLYIEYGQIDKRMERTLTVSIACDLALGQKRSTICLNLRNEDIESQ